MKILFKTLFILLAFVSASAFVMPPVKQEVLVIKTKIYCDHCKKCESCEPRMVTAVEALDGVSAVTLDVPKEELTVYYNSKKTTPDAIRMAVVNCGFAADNLPPNKDAYFKLDECCQKHE